MELFSRTSRWTSNMLGRPIAFLLAGLVVLLWAVLGPAFGYSDTWQLTINTGTTIVTFLMVFLIQNTQNRHSDAIQIKLDELIRAVAGAHNYLMDMEEATEGELEEFKRRYRSLHEIARQQRARGLADTGAEDPDVPKL
jgi:low affinity Fe/Cu permease